MDRQIQVTPEDSQAHGLPPLGLDLDLSGTAMLYHLFLGGGSYLTMSGPPGGPVGFSLVAFSGSLLEYVTEHFTGVASFQMGQPGTVRLSGQDYPSLGFQMGTQLAHTQNCAVHVGPAVAVFSCGGSTTVGDGTEVFRHPDLARIRERLRLYG
jgi:hypothetical protein